jgi:hypothetical protein
MASFVDSLPPDLFDQTTLVSLASTLAILATGPAGVLVGQLARAVHLARLRRPDPLLPRGELPLPLLLLLDAALVGQEPAGVGSDGPQLPWLYQSSLWAAGRWR